MSKAKKKDPQSTKFQLTINNPLEKGWTHEKIFKQLRDNFKTFAYCCMADEQGSCFHTHILATFDSRVRFSTVKRNFSDAHIEIAKGTVSQNISYIKKSGKWEDTDKHETVIEGSFEEYGIRPPDSKGNNNDMSELYQMIVEGKTNAEILAINQDYILNIDKLDKVRTTVLSDFFKSTIRLDLRVIYIYGVTGSGKTSGILKEHGCADVYRVTDYDHPFDGYNCQPVICFDEFRNSLRLKDMLTYCDIYPIELPARYSNKFACYYTVYIVSNWALEKQYAELQKEDDESWQAFLRRIHEVRYFKAKDEVIVYHSVQEYLNRDEGFYEPSPEELKNCPFNI